MLTRSALAFASIVLLAACAPEDRGRVGQNAPLLALREELRLGSVDDPNEGFSRIGAVAVDSEGNVFVVERQSLEIRVFGPDGVRLRTIGRRGQGPAEFGSINQIGFKGDTLWVNDTRLGRVSLLTREGKLLGTFPGAHFVPIHTSVSSIMPMARGGSVRSDGYIHLEDVSAIAILGGATTPDSVRVPILRFDREGALVDTAYTVVLYRAPNDDKGGPNRPAQTEMLRDPGPPSDTPLRLRNDDAEFLIERRASISADSSAFAVTKLTLGGDTVYRAEIPYRPHPYASALRDSLANALGGDQAVPRFQPPVSAAQVGSDGTLWLRREEQRSAAQNWLIIDPRGRSRGEVQLPTRASVRWVSADLAYVVESDSLDVPWLVRYRVE